MLGNARRTFDQNWHDLLQTHWQLFMLFFAALFCDALSTTYVMRLRGIDGELHPLIRLVSEAFGPLTDPLFGAIFKAVAGIVVASYFVRLAKLILAAAASAAFLAACYNMWATKLYLAGILHNLPI